MLIQDVSGNGFGIRGSTFPHDWTEGTGVFPSGGVITVAAPTNGAKRKWLLIQNQGAASITVAYQSQDKYGSATTAILVLASGGSAGAQGAADERDIWQPNGTVVITGNAGSAVLVLEVVE